MPLQNNEKDDKTIHKFLSFHIYLLILNSSNINAII